MNNQCCDNNVCNESQPRGGNGLLIVVVLYILLAIIFSSFTRTGYGY